MFIFPSNRWYVRNIYIYIYTYVYVDYALRYNIPLIHFSYTHTLLILLRLLYIILIDIHYIIHIIHYTLIFTYYTHTLIYSYIYYI